MSQLNVIDQCEYPLPVLCHYCDEQLKEDDKKVNSQWNPLADQINTLSTQLIRLNIEDLTFNSREKLGQWRDSCCLMIQQIYERKCQELNRRCVKRIVLLQTEIDQSLSKMTKFMCEKEVIPDDLEILTSNIDDIKRKVEHLKADSFVIHFQPFHFDGNLVSIEETKVYQLNLSQISKPYRNFSCTDQSWPSMVANEQFFLVDQYPKLLLYNEDLKLVQQTLWTYGSIRNVSWSSILASFIIINNEKQVFLVKEKSLIIERVHKIEEQYWWSCTCSDTSLFLTNTTMGTNIYQYDLLCSFQFIKRWKPPSSCKQHEYIDDIKYNNGTLALIIKVSSSNTVHLELRSSLTLDQLWKVQLNVNKNWFQQTIRCCPVLSDEWLIVEGNTSHLFHILKNGELNAMEKYEPSPINAVLFRENTLVIRTKTNLVFHKL